MAALLLVVEEVAMRHWHHLDRIRKTVSQAVMQLIMLQVVSNTFRIVPLHVCMCTCTQCACVCTLSSGFHSYKV